MHVWLNFFYVHQVQGHTHRFKLLDGIIQSTCRDTAKLIGYDETPINFGPPDDIQSQEINGVEGKELVGTSNRACTASNETTMLGSDSSHESHYLIGGRLTAGMRFLLQDLFFEYPLQ